MSRLRAVAPIVGFALVLGVCMLIDLEAVQHPASFVAYGAVTAVALIAVQLRSGVWTVAASVSSIALTVAILIVHTGSASCTEWAALLFLLAQRWRTAHGPRDIALVALVASAVVLSPLRVHDGGMWFVLAAGLVILTVAFATGIRTLDARRTRAVRITRSAERETMSRELHDVVAHHVAGLVVTAQAAQLDDDPVRMGAALASIERAGRAALDVTRRLAADMRSSNVDEDFTPAEHEGLAGLVDRFAATGVVGVIRVTIPTRIADVAVATTLHRIVQESLTNIQHHARGAEIVEVRIVETPLDGFELSVSDSGGRPAMTPDQSRRQLGILGMRERVEALGGTLSVGARGGGWVVRAIIPSSAR